MKRRTPRPAFWLKMQAKAEEGVQAVLKARAAKEQVGKVIEAGPRPPVTFHFRSRGTRCGNRHALHRSRRAAWWTTGATLVQIISEPTKGSLAKLVMLHNIMETTEWSAEPTHA